MQVQFKLRIVGQIDATLSEIVEQRGRGKRCAEEIDPEWLLRKIINRAIQIDVPCKFGNVLVQEAEVTSAKAMDDAIVITSSEDALYDRALMQRIQEQEDAQTQ
jgi:hypothetical protein